MAMTDFVREVAGREKTLTVLNRTDPDAVQRMLDRLFDGQSVTVTEAEADAGPANIVLLSAADGEVAVSTLDDVRDAVLVVNADLYVTGARTLDEVETPEVLARLDELPFSIRGYPDTSKGKMLLIEISRYIEARAFRAGEGRLHAGFQRLSRLTAERGTERVYRRLVDETDVDVLAYGVPDRTEPIPAGVTANGEDCEELRHTWFVVYTHPRNADRNAALVAVTGGDNEWKGFWTYDPDRTADIAGYLAAEYGG